MMPILKKTSPNKLSQFYIIHNDIIMLIIHFIEQKVLSRDFCVNFDKNLLRQLHGIYSRLILEFALGGIHCNVIIRYERIFSF